MSDIDLVKKVRVYAEEAEKNGFEVLTVPLRDLFPLLGRMEAPERERDELRKTLQATQGSETEAIKNVMLMQEEISRLDKESQSLSDQLGACDLQRLDWLKRAMTAEAEIARRDAAAGEPVAYQIHSDLEGWRECTPERYAEVSTRPLVDGKYSGGWLVRKLHTAAQPAMLPPPMTYANALKVSDWKNDQASIWTEGANWMREQCFALDAQPQKPVVLPGYLSYAGIPAEYPSYAEEIAHQRGFEHGVRRCKEALDAANVPYEVKK